MNCPHCGTQQLESESFCKRCGESLQSHNVHARSADAEMVIPADHKPISVLGYMGYALLFGLPVVGGIIMIYFAFSRSNINVRNYARASFFGALIGVLVGVAVLTFMDIGIVYL